MQYNHRSDASVAGAAVDKVNPFVNDRGKK